MVDKNQNSVEKKDAKIRDSFSLSKNRNFWILILSAILLNLAGFFLLWWQIKPTESAVILHYNAFLGIDIIDFNLKEGYYELFVAPTGGAIIWLINTSLSFLLLGQAGRFSKKGKVQESSERIIGSYLILTSSIIVQLGLLVYVLDIIVVNT